MALQRVKQILYIQWNAKNYSQWLTVDCCLKKYGWPSSGDEPTPIHLGATWNGQCISFLTGKKLKLRGVESWREIDGVDIIILHSIFPCINMKLSRIKI